MKFVILKRAGSSQELRVTDVSPGCSFGTMELSTGDHLLLEDIIALAEQGFSLVLVQHDDPAPSGPLRPNKV